MKKLFTIFLLLLLTGYVTAPFHSTSDEIKVVLDCEEKKEKTGGEEKKEDKEYISYLSFSKPETTDKQAFAFYFIISSLSPALDRPTPPPDNRLSV